MAKIECLSATPYVRFRPKHLRLLKAIAGQGDKCTVFLLTERNGAAFSVEDLYVPKQSCGTAYNIVNEDELGFLKKGYGVCRCTGTVLPEIKTDDEKFFRACFGPIKEQVRMQISKSGASYVDIALGDFVIRGASIISYDPVTTDDIEKAKKVLKERTKVWTFHDGYDQPSRIVYETPDFVAKNYDWRKMVGAK